MQIGNHCSGQQGEMVLDPRLDDQRTASQATGPCIPSRAAVQDSLFLSAVVLASLVLYVHHLGFYSDDWGYLELLGAARGHSFYGFLLTYVLTDVRPVQILCLEGLYRLFGVHPLGYHLFNAGVLVSLVLLFYMTLRELGEVRPITLSTALVYALLPHFSTDRFWIAAFQANVSMALCFLGYYSALKSLSAPCRHVWKWRLICVLALLGGVLAYEVCLPFLFLLPLVIWIYRREGFDSPFSRTTAWARCSGICDGYTNRA